MVARNLWGIFVAFAAAFGLAACGGEGGTDSTGRGKPDRRGTPSRPGEQTPTDGGNQARQAVPGEVGTVVGVVQFEGAPRTDELRIDLGWCLAHGAQERQPDPSCEVVDGKLPHALVWVEGMERYDWPRPTEPVVLDQKACLYSRVVVAVPVGGSMVVRNSDDTIHNVKASPAHNPSFNISQPGGAVDQTIEFRMPEPRPFEIVCDVHPWMKAWAHVLRHPKFAVTGRDGTFRIEGVPAGRHTLRVWHPRYGHGSSEVEVVAGAEPQPVAITLRGS